MTTRKPRTPEQRAARRVREAELRRLKNPKLFERSKMSDLQKRMLRSAKDRSRYQRDRERILARKKAAYAANPAPQIARVYAARGEDKGTSLNG